jgi:hypothetical protein
MDLRAALKEQYHAGLAMLAECVEKCPDDLWTSGTHPRTFWRIAFHAAFFTHNYLVQDEAASFYSPSGALTINGGAPSVGRDAITEVARGS